MNNHLNVLLFVASTLLLASCSEDNKSFETPNTSGTPLNDNLISQNNFTLRFDPVDPKFYDPVTGIYTSVTSEVSVQIGDNKNQLITGSRVINFRTEWGLIDPSCTTDESGTCSVTWRSSSPSTAPKDLFNTITAFSHGGQESYADINGNGRFDDGDTFGDDLYADVDEPFVNIDGSGFTNSNGGYVSTFTTGDIIIDTINGVDLTGADTIHNAGDGLFNGPDCAHSTLCSPTRSTVTVWADASQLLNGGAIYTISGTVSGLGTGDEITVNNNGAESIIFTEVNGDFSYEIIGGFSYNITATITTGSVITTCPITNGSATPTADVTDVTIACS